MTHIICNGGNVVRYAFGDEVNIDILMQKIVTPTYDIGDLHLGNCTYHKDVTLPEDFVDSKYIYDGEWSLNPEYVEVV